MNTQQLHNIIDQIDLGDTIFGAKYGWRILHKGDGHLLQFMVCLDCNEGSGDKPEWQHGEKRYISQHAAKNEVVNAAFDLVKKFYEHEIRELFKYRGQPIYQPHQDVDALAELVQDTGMVGRITEV